MRRITSVRKGWLIGAVALLALVAAGAVQSRVGTSIPASRDSAGSASTSVGEAAPIAPAAGAAADAAGPATKELAPSSPAGPSPTAVVPGAPKVVRTADLRVKVGKGGFGGAFDRVASIAAADGGFVVSSSTSSADGARSGDLTVRVPADRFDAARQSLGALGSVETQSIRGEDVSGQLVDYDARLKSLQAQEDALRVLVGQAKAVGEVLQVQSSLFNVRQQIEQLTAQRANLDQSASLATIHVSMFEPGAAATTAPPADDRSLAHSMAKAVDGMLAVVGGMIVVLGWVLPPLGVGLVVWGASRLRRRRPTTPAPVV
jgi:hypothetical protein